ncbi:MAG: Rrf2 family transcriptional regulator [Chloroflexi bacterium]|nr:Rrf2 family transcriptional regulator [Chloroflexota bacterium]MDA8188138.1 Rrf2 family transcriptional regulator [Dehalococcoidales bacterium]
MQISRRGDYSVRAMIDIASRPEGEMALTHEVAQRQGIPRSFLVKIIGQLAKAGLLRAFRGATGGVYLARPADQISLRQIIEAVEGPIHLNRCLIRPGECNLDTTCPVHAVWEEAQNHFLQLFDSKTLADLLEDSTILDGSITA